MAGPLYGSPVNWGHPLNRGLVAWWLPLTGGGLGGTLHDLCLARYTIPITAAPGLAAGPSPRYGSLRLNGSTQYARYAGAVVSSIPLTMACWLRTTDTSSTFRCPFTISDSSSTVRYAVLQLANGTGSTKGAGRYNITNTTAALSDSTVVLTDGVWHHLVGVSIAVNSHRVYIDGIQAGSSSTNVSAFPACDSTNIGRLDFSGGAIQYFPGDVTDVRLYNRALSADEVYGLYVQGLRGHPDTLRRLPRRSWLSGPPAAAPGGFQAAWARGANVLIGAGRA